MRGDVPRDGMLDVMKDQEEEIEQRQESDDTPRCPVCSSPIQSIENPDADGQARIHPCNHYVTAQGADEVGMR